jgi:fumarate reductase subunit C
MCSHQSWIAASSPAGKITRSWRLSVERRDNGSDRRHRDVSRTEYLDPGLHSGLNAPAEGRRELIHELISGGSGLLLALFMWGHVLLVGSILTGARGFDWLATWLEDYYVAQPTVVLVPVLFLLHAAFAARKIPAKLEERRQILRLSMNLLKGGGRRVRGEDAAAPFRPHLDSLLWIWQVRTGLVILVLGSFHLVLLALDVLTPLFGDRQGIESATTLARVSGGLWPLYGLLLVSVEFHASVGLYRLAIKWGSGSRLSRQALRQVERVLFWSILGLGTVTLLVLAGWLPPPLAFLLEGGGG